MPVETKKVLWTVFSVGAFLVIVLGVLLVAFYPKPGAENAPLALALPGTRGSAADRYTRPVAPAPLPDALPAQSPAPVVVVPYGEKPEPGSLVPLPAAGSTGPAPTATVVPSATAPSAASTTGAATIAASDPAIKRTYAPASSGAPSVTVTPEAKPAAGAISTKPAAGTGTTTAPAASTAPKPASAAPVKPAYVDEYWIQAGSFANRTRAEDLQALLRGKGLSSTIEARDAATGVVYRVRIGPWTRKDVADGWLETVRKVEGCSDAYVSKVTRKT